MGDTTNIYKNMDKELANIIDYEDVLQEDLQQKWSFPLTNKIRQLPSIPPSTSDEGNNESNEGGSGKKKRGGGKGKKKAGEGEGQMCGSDYPIRVAEKIKDIKEKWLPINRPHYQIQEILRGIIVDLYAQGSTTGSFTIQDVSIKYSRVKVEVHKCKSGLWVSLLKTARKILRDKSGCDELSAFYMGIQNCQTLENYQKLYFQPLLYSARETVYFFLDLLLIEQDRKSFMDIKCSLDKYYDMTPIFTKIKNTEGLEGLLSQISKKNEVRSMLGIVKALSHHYQQYLGENMSVENIYEVLYNLSNRIHLEVFEELLKRDVNFMLLCE